jgi:4-alpha-glucanotransferase
VRGSGSAYVFYQFKFFEQWTVLKSYANQRGISIFGDIPIFVAMDSADVWRHPSLFQMDAVLRPTGVAGVPPDYFAADGQLWGNPLYAWDRHAEDDYAWWCARFRKAFELYDVVRIDHFRGFDEYCRISPNAKNAREYTWEPGPGSKLLDAVSRQLPNAKLVAEDLGTITDSVRRLMRDAGLPGMKVLQFAFEGTTEYLPHSTTPYSVLYPGTHDNDTSRGWFRNQPYQVKRFFREYLRTDATDVPWDMIHAGYVSTSRVFIAPLQDYFGFGSETRMNTPGRAEGNWRWRFSSEQLDRLWEKRGGELKAFARLYQR